ncbi:MAG: CHC2 zinc finger domain-containing protein [Bacteroidia bacterium]|nr:CHC2 zinc finger domain-containing protein [Bacteroidia bacterium]
MITQIDINRIAEATDIVQLVGRTVSLKRQGANMVGCCPFHNEKTGSFVVSPAKQTYHCFGCGEHGDVFSWVMRREGCNFPDAVRRLAKLASIEIRERERTAEEIAAETKREAMYMITSRVNGWFVAQLKNKPEAMKYALSRWGVRPSKKDGIEENQYIESTGIGYAPGGRAFIDWARAQGINMDLLRELRLIGKNENGGEYAMFRDRITIPIRSRSNLIEGWTCRDLTGRDDLPKYLNSSDSELYNKRSSLFGIDLAKPEIRSTGKVYVAEGAPDVMRLQIIGVPNAVAPLGTGTMGEEQFELLQSCFPKSGKRILCILPDADVTKADGSNPGLNTAVRIGEKAVSRGYSVLIKNIPEENVKQDPDSYFKSKSLFQHTPEEDFILWHAGRLIDKAGNVEETNTAITQIAGMVARIDDETLVENYLKELKRIYNNPTVWKKAVSRATKELKKKEVEEKAFSKDGFTKYGFYESGGGYWSLSGQTEMRWSNFTMRPLFHIKDVVNPKRIYELRNETGLREIVELKQEDLVSLSKFRQRIEGLGNYIFEANEQCLIKLKRYLYEQTQTATEVTQLGWQRQGFYSFGNGALYQGSFIKADDYGVVKLPDGQNYYLPGSSKIYKDDSLFQFEKRFVHLGYSSADLRTVADSMINVFGDNAKVGLCFLIATLFRDVVTATLKSFPILNLFGPKGSGKSELGHTLMSFFIIQNIPPNLSNSTIAALSESVAQCSNAIVHLDEFKNNIDLDKREFLKGLWDSAGRTRMNMDRDKKREQTRVDSGIIISGQEMATADIALFSRFVYLTFNKTEFTVHERNSFAELDRMRKLGFSHLTLEILNHREVFKQNFQAMYSATAAEVMDRLGDNVCESRIVNNWTTLAAAYRTLEQLVDLPFSYGQILKISVDGIIRQNRECKSGDEIASFWSVIAASQQDGDFVMDYDYKIRFDSKISTMKNTFEFKTPRRMLLVNCASIYSAYSRKARDMEISRLNKNSLEYYLENSKEYLGKVRAVRFKSKEKGMTLYVVENESSKMVPGSATKMAYCFDYEKLADNYGISLEVQVSNDDDG